MKTIPCPLADSILIPRLDLVHLKPRWLPVRIGVNSLVKGGISQSKKRKKAILPVHEKSLRGSLTVVGKLRSILQ